MDTNRAAAAGRRDYASRVNVRLPSAILLAAALGAPAVQAETYKWVDEKGVVNYSNAPPPSAKSAKALKIVEERISVYQADPGLARLADVYRRLDLIESDYRQRQAYLPNYAAASLAASGGCTWPNGPICDYPYRVGSYLPYYATPFLALPVLRPASFTTMSFGRPFSGRASGGARSGR